MFDALIQNKESAISPKPALNTPQTTTLLPLELYTDLPRGLTPMPMPKLPEAPSRCTKTKREKLQVEVRRQREMAANIYLRAKTLFLQNGCKQPGSREIPLTADGRLLFTAIRKTFVRVMKKKTESQWLCTLGSNQHEEVLQALLLVSLKSVVTDGTKVSLWKIGGRFSGLQKELRDENNKAVELAQIWKVCSEDPPSFTFSAELIIWLCSARRNNAI